MDKLHLLTFSPTGTSRKVAEGIARGTGMSLSQDNDITHKSAGNITFGSDEILLVSVPVYGGHVAPTATARMNDIRGNGTMAVAVVVYGNRHYEQALEELATFLDERGFRVIGAATFIGEHSYSTTHTPIALGRPDKQDMAFAEEFGTRIAQKLSNESSPSTVDASCIDKPEQDADVMMRFKQTVMGWMKEGMQMPAKPLVDEELCTGCATCADLCPTGAIPSSAPNTTEAEKCIKCCACVKGCPAFARTLSTPFAQLLRENFAQRKENKVLL